MVAPYWHFWEAVVDDDPSAPHRRLMSQSSALAREFGDVRWSVLTDELDKELEAVDLVVVVTTMAAPPEKVRTFLKTRSACVVLVWAHHDTARIPEPFTHESITLRGATVGASMMTASLSQEGIEHDVVVGHSGSPEVRRSLSLAAAAAKVRGARLTVVGRPLGGYDFVLPPESELERLGIDIVAHTSEELAEHCDRLMDSDVAGLRAELSEQFGAVTTELGLDAALRYSVALREIVLGDGASAGAVNCHSPAIRGNSRFGEVAPCFALGRETSCGRPFTCTGDVNTSLAMLIVASLGRPTMYHEMEAIDEVTDEVILANSGEHDDRFTSSNPVRAVANPWFPGGHPTPILAAQIAAGPASVVAVTVVDSRLRVIIAEGEFTDRRADLTGTMCAAFRFAGETAGAGWTAWVRAGAGHHACATDSHVREDLSALCRHLGLELVTVGRSHNVVGEA